MTVADWPACSTLDPDRSEFSCALCSAAAYCCGAVAPRAIAALLGRFLPRLGPLVHSSGPFFFGGHSLSSFRDAPSGAGPESITTIENMDSGLAPSGAPRNDVRVLLPLLRRGLERAEIAERYRGQRVRKACEVGDHLRKPRGAFAPPFIHVDRAVEFELHRVQSA